MQNVLMSTLSINNTPTIQLLNDMHALNDKQQHLSTFKTQILEACNKK